MPAPQGLWSLRIMAVASNDERPDGGDVGLNGSSNQPINLEYYIRQNRTTWE